MFAVASLPEGSRSGMPETTRSEPTGPGSRALVIALLIAAALLAVVPVFVARTRGVERMRIALAEVLHECRARYAAAASAADSAAADAWQPAPGGTRRPDDPTCGPYRRRNMLGPAR